MKKNKSKKIPILLIMVLVIILIFCFYEISILLKQPKENKLKKLNYTDEAIEVINKFDIEDKVSEKEYSKTLEAALLSGNFKLENLDLYYYFEYKEDDRFINDLNSLSSIGYNQKEITEIFELLSFDNIDKLLNHSYVENLTEYLKYDYFKIDYLDRYIEYYKKTSSYEKSITYVNIGLDKNFYEDYKVVDNASSTLVLVNKYNFLPSDYVPEDLVTLGGSYSITNVKMKKEAAKKFEELSTDASTLGLSILGMSGYRSYEYQKNLYNRYKANDPKNVDTYSARPGASEHQTGLALDVATKTTTYTNFGKTKEYTWLKENAHKYGFIIRYTKDNMSITGYKSEEWHIRYVGEEVAKYIYENNITFDEYYVKFLEK